jgi:Sec-independent protein translocase protein TatA
VNEDAKIAELRAVTREANEALRDLRQAIREARRLAKEATDAVDEQVQAHVVAEVAKLEAATDRAMRESVAKCIGEFDKLTNTLMGRDRASLAKRGNVDLETAVLQRLERDQP